MKHTHRVVPNRNTTHGCGNDLSQTGEKSFLLTFLVRIPRTVRLRVRRLRKCQRDSLSP